LLKEVIHANRDPEKTQARLLAYTPLIILEPNETMVTAMKIMAKKGFKRAAMVKQGQLTGMLTEKASKKVPLKLKAA